MIKILMFQDKWRIKIGDCYGETFEFDKTKDMLVVLNQLVKIKDDYGRIKK